MTTTIKVKTDESIVSKLRNAFTSPACVLSEGMQNARRANATEVVFTMLDEGANVLQIVDNGDGIASLQDFLTLSGSGWSEEVIQKEGAFGMGSYSMLYSCDYIKVESNGKMFEGLTQDILNGGEITVTPSSVLVGTVITLTGYVLSDETNTQDIHKSLVGLARGFAIQVFWGNEEIDRPDSLGNENLVFINTELGQIKLTDIERLKKVEPNLYPFSGLGISDSRLYFQGLPVGTGDLWRKGDLRLNIIHLDESLFSVRMPDRDVLISHVDQEGKIREMVKAMWQQALLEAKTSFPSKIFVKELFTTLTRWDCVELLNDMDELPEGILFQVTDEPHQERVYHDECFSTDVTSMSKKDLDNSGIKLLRINEYCNEESITEWTYAHHGKFTCCDPKRLHSDHWIFNDYMVEVDEENRLEVSMVDAGEDSVFRGDWCYFTTYSGSRVKMSGPVGDAYSDNSCVFVGDDSISVSNYGMYIPSKALSGSDINIANCFSNNDDWDETAANNEENLFEAYLLSINESKDNAIIKLLNDSRVSMLNLVNQTISVTFDENGRAVLVGQAA